MRALLLASAIGCMAIAAPASAATHLVDASGKLTGATGVIVGDVSYDVTFHAGTCAQVFSGCTKSSLVFKGQTTALQAVNALRDQVFIDTAAGKFDSDPTLTFGCTAVQCSLSVPYSASDSWVISAVLINNQFHNPTLAFSSRSIDQNYEGNLVLVRFMQTPIISPTTNPAAVPEPATWAMMILGFGVVGGSMRRRPKLAVRFA